MKKNLFIFLALFISLNSYCQFAIVKDINGFVNVFHDKNVNSRVYGQIYSDEIVEVSLQQKDNDNNSWCCIDFLIAKSNMQTGDKSIGENASGDSVWINGYVKQTNLQLVDELPEIQGNYTKTNNNTIRFRNAFINFNVTFEPFIPQNHKIIYSNQGVIQSIDDFEPLITGKSLPETSIKSVSLVINNAEVYVPKIVYKDIYNIDCQLFKFRSDNKNIYIDMPFRENCSGIWNGIWIIRGGELHKVITRKYYK